MTTYTSQFINKRTIKVDDAEAIANGTVLGTKAAAIRKLEHELGKLHIQK
jgi:hypothetical protein